MNKEIYYIQITIQWTIEVILTDYVKNFAIKKIMSRSPWLFFP
jgi:hypothetical protein